MKARFKNIVLLASATVFMGIGTITIANATPTTLIDQGAQWNYSTINVDLWPNWTAAGYSSVDWNTLSYSQGNAAFGNQTPYNTLWTAGTDLALYNTFTINGDIETPITLNVASDNGFIIFINGTQVAKENAEGYTSYWEYTFNLSDSPFNSGSNTIQVLAEDHGGWTFFDMKLTGDVTAVPEPASMLLFGTGVVGLAAFSRKKQK